MLGDNDAGVPPCSRLSLPLGSPGVRPNGPWGVPPPIRVGDPLPWVCPPLQRLLKNSMWGLLTRPGC